MFASNYQLFSNFFLLLKTITKNKNTGQNKNSLLNYWKERKIKILLIVLIAASYSNQNEKTWPLLKAVFWNGFSAREKNFELVDDRK